jgi:hypothetical protein
MCSHGNSDTADCKVTCMPCSFGCDGFNAHFQGSGRRSRGCVGRDIADSLQFEITTTV